MHRLYLTLASALALTACEGGTVGITIPEPTPAETCEEFGPQTLPRIVDGEVQSFEGYGFVGPMWATSTALTEAECLACTDGRCVNVRDAGTNLLYLGDWSDDSAGEWCSVFGELTCGPVWDDGVCGFVMEAEFSCAVDGRPLLVDGHALTAESRPGAWGSQTLTLQEVAPAQREAVRTRWIQAGLTEHASVAAFARFSLQLMALGAPADLLLDASTAAADEVHHADACFAVASALGPSVGPSTLPVHDLSSPGGAQLDAESVLRSTFLEGCLGETVAAALARSGR